ncbi:hypothetical protein IFM89_014464 [Coptis chinensis]|uniref:Uncharacterized protein n=1 Tax=Coptis chinensis TaxID=261450 RepID=A0A835I048_9MAGN|nr:hypothetical protein IFM89_014464 [Coptis chinensis]
MTPKRASEALRLAYEAGIHQAPHLDQLIRNNYHVWGDVQEKELGFVGVNLHEMFSKLKFPVGMPDLLPTSE